MRGGIEFVRRGGNLPPVTGLDSRLRGNDEWGDAKALNARLRGNDGVTQIFSFSGRSKIWTLPCVGNLRHPFALPFSAALSLASSKK